MTLITALKAPVSEITFFNLPSSSLSSESAVKFSVITFATAFASSPSGKKEPTIEAILPSSLDENSKTVVASAARLPLNP